MRYRLRIKLELRDTNYNDILCKTSYDIHYISEHIASYTFGRIVETLITLGGKVTKIKK